MFEGHDNRMLKLYHKSTLIGLITNPEPDGLGMVGTIQLTEAATDYKEAFHFMTDDDKRSANSPFDEDVFENWFVEDEQGVRRETVFPAVHEDGEIYWRTQHDSPKP